MAKTSALHLYALALGSNRARSAALPPVRLLDEAAARIAHLGRVRAVAPTLASAPLGPSLRRYANSALLLESELPPQQLLVRLHEIERQLGRRRHRRWGARRIDIDIILWSGGRWNSRTLNIPHPAYRIRTFVLTPLRTIAPQWRDPVSGLTIRQLEARLRKATPVPQLKVDQPHHPL